MVHDPELAVELIHREAVVPDHAKVVRWHLDRAVERFAELEPADAPTVVLHSDLTPWNLLWDSDELTGVLDFESTHLDLRVADFALSWRGEHDEVIRGYDEVSPLTDLERELIAPTYWAWMMLGVARELKAHRLTGSEPYDLTWVVEMLRRRTPMMGRDSLPCPH